MKPRSGRHHDGQAAPGLCRHQSEHVKDEGAAYVAELEDTEDRILHAFEDAMEDADPDLRAALAVEMPKVRACHDRMRDLKHSMK